MAPCHAPTLRDLTRSLYITRGSHPPFPPRNSRRRRSLRVGCRCHFRARHRHTSRNAASVRTSRPREGGLRGGAPYGTCQRRAQLHGERQTCGLREFQTTRSMCGPGPKRPPRLHLRALFSHVDILIVPQKLVLSKTDIL